MRAVYRRGDVRRRQIALAALDLLAEGGVTAVTTRAIAERVGVSEAALFRHFASKQAILDGALDALEDLMFPAPPQGDAAGEGEGDALARLERFFRRRVEVVAGPTALGHLVFSQELVHATGDAGQARLAAWRARSAEAVLDLLRELHADGRTRRGLAPEHLLPVVQGQVLAFAVDRALQASAGPPLGPRLDRAWALLEHVLLEPR